MGKFGRREGAQTNSKAKSRHGLMSVVIFDHQDVCTKAKAFVTSIANAAISLANWSTNEENAAIRDTCAKMYELSMLLSSAVNLFSKEYSVMGNSLKELLRQEMNLDGLNKKVCQVEIKATKLKKQNVENEKKLESLGKAELEYEELKASFDAQNTKHEILKAQCLRESITRFADGAKLFAAQVSTISEAEKKIASSIPVVPTQIGQKEYQGEEATEEVVQRTADALNFARPVSFMDILAEKRARARKVKVKSCFMPESNEPNSPELMDWVMVEQSMSASLIDIRQDSECRPCDEDRRLNAEMLSCLKERLHIDSTGGRSYISNPAIERRLALRARGLSATDDCIKPPVPPPTRSRAREDSPADLPRVEPYAVSRWKPDGAGLYARADLFPSGVTRPPSIWQAGDKRRETTDSGEYTMPKEVSNENDVVYAVLEQEGTDVTEDERYLDVIQ